MQLDAQALSKDIVSEVAAVKKASPNAVPAALAAAKPSDFCGIWPKAKPVLEFLAGIVVFIPGAGATAGAVLTGLIKVGDQVAAQICK